MIPQKVRKNGSSERLRELWPDIREMMRPRRKVLAIGFVLMVISRVCGLVLPTSTKYLIDNVIGKQQMSAAAAAGAGGAGRHRHPGHHRLRTSRNWFPKPASA